MKGFQNYVQKFLSHFASFSRQHSEEHSTSYVTGNTYNSKNSSCSNRSNGHNDEDEDVEWRTFRLIMFLPLFAVSQQTETAINLHGTSGSGWLWDKKQLITLQRQSGSRTFLLCKISHYQKEDTGWFARVIHDGMASVTQIYYRVK